MMVVSDGTRAWSRRDKNPIVDMLEAHEVQDSYESSRATPLSRTMATREVGIHHNGCPKEFHNNYH